MKLVEWIVLRDQKWSPLLKATFAFAKWHFLKSVKSVWVLHLRDDLANAKWHLILGIRGAAFWPILAFAKLARKCEMALNKSPPFCWHFAFVKWARKCEMAINPERGFPCLLASPWYQTPPMTPNNINSYNIHFRQFIDHPTTYINIQLHNPYLKSITIIHVSLDFP